MVQQVSVVVILHRHEPEHYGSKALSQASERESFEPPEVRKQNLEVMEAGKSYACSTPRREL